jgi:hypothetical protein
MCNIGLGNLRNVAGMKSITEIGLSKIRREFVDWILLALVLPSDTVECQM